MYTRPQSTSKPVYEFFVFIHLSMHPNFWFVALLTFSTSVNLNHIRIQINAATMSQNKEPSKSKC